MGDKNLMENILLLEKGVCDLFLHGTIESSTSSVHQAFSTALHDSLGMQDTIYDTVSYTHLPCVNTSLFSFWVCKRNDTTYVVSFLLPSMQSFIYAIPVDNMEPGINIICPQILVLQVISCLLYTSRCV